MYAKMYEDVIINIIVVFTFNNSSRKKEATGTAAAVAVATAVGKNGNLLLYEHLVLHSRDFCCCRLYFCSCKMQCALKCICSKGVAGGGRVREG